MYSGNCYPIAVIIKTCGRKIKTSESFAFKIRKIINMNVSLVLETGKTTVYYKSIKKQSSSRLTCVSSKILHFLSTTFVETIFFSDKHKDFCDPLDTMNPSVVKVTAYNRKRVIMKRAQDVLKSTQWFGGNNNSRSPKKPFQKSLPSYFYDQF